MSGWKITTIGDICDLTNGTVQTGPFGSDLHASDYSATGTPVIMPANLRKNQIVEDGIARVSKDHVFRLKNHQLITNDIIFPRRGDVARYALIDKRYEGWLCGTGCLRIRFENNSIIDAKYLGYWLGTPTVEEWLLSNAVGTTMPNLNTSILKALPVPLPPLPEQRAIAEILGSLDDKLEANRRQNETLEATARAIFQSWFVDFDPVHAKARGETPPGMDAETAALFPDSFEESALGLIPHGWGVGTLGDYSTIIKGKSYKSSELETSHTALVTLKSFHRGGGYNPDGLKSYTGTYKPEQVIAPGEVVVAYTDITQKAEVIGRPIMVHNDPRYEILIASLDTAIVRPKTPLNVSFLYFMFMTENFNLHALSYTNGSTVLHLNKDALPNYEFTVPDRYVLENFADMTESIFTKISVNDAESRTLAETRDALLPRLVSGALRVGVNL